MAAGQGFKTFTTGEVLTAGDVNGYLMQGINVFATTTARDAAITAPAEGQFAFTKDTNSLWYYDGAAWVASGATGDIEGVTAGVGISGGGTSGTVTVTNSMATAIDAKGDLVPGTGADTFARLGVGANNTVLTADSAEATGLKWATPAATATNYTLLNSGGTSMSGSTSISITGISGVGKIYIFIQNAAFVNTNVYAKIRINSDSAGNYSSWGSIISGNSSYSAGIIGYQNFVGQSEIRIGRSSSNSASTLTGGVSIDGCNSAGSKMVISNTGADAGGGTGNFAMGIFGYYTGTSTVSSVQIMSDDGNFSGGTVYVYGA
jgi:hypothetical protein